MSDEAVKTSNVLKAAEEIKSEPVVRDETLKTVSCSTQNIKDKCAIGVVKVKSSLSASNDDQSEQANDALKDTRRLSMRHKELKRRRDEVVGDGSFTSVGKVMKLAKVKEVPASAVSEPIPFTIKQGNQFSSIPEIMERDRVFRLNVNAGRKFLKPKYTLKHVGRWKPQDDILLINSVLSTNCLLTTFRAVKFSCHFTLREIQERWHNLLYCPLVSKLAYAAICNLHHDQKLELMRKMFFSNEEENVLKRIKSTPVPSLDDFEKVLEENLLVFKPARSSKDLRNHWLQLKQFHLLFDQTVQPFPRGEHVLNFSDAEDMIDDLKLIEKRDEILERELAVADRRQKREMNILEEEVSRWQAMVESATEISNPQFDSQTLAILRGRLVRYLMRSKEITLGRSANNHSIDVDLSLEGPAAKVSRRQGTIRLKHTGEFHLSNDGKRPFYVNGRPLLKGFKCWLYNNSVVEVAGLRFIFLINENLATAIRNEAAKIIA